MLVLLSVWGIWYYHQIEEGGGDLDVSNRYTPKKTVDKKPTTTKLRIKVSTNGGSVNTTVQRPGEII